MGLRVGLYGAGWEKHPQLAKYARGPVAFGADLDELTRHSAINLQIVPFLCLHQRLLDGISAGGFFLIREHPSDVAPQVLLDLLEAHCGANAWSVAEASGRIPSGARDSFNSILLECERCLCSMRTEDAVEMVRTWQEAELLVAGEGVLPAFEDVRFRSRQEL